MNFDFQLGFLFIFAAIQFDVSLIQDKKNNRRFYYINFSGIASGSKLRKMVSHMCG